MFSPQYKYKHKHRHKYKYNSEWRIHLRTVVELIIAAILPH